MHSAFLPRFAMALLVCLTSAHAGDGAWRKFDFMTFSLRMPAEMREVPVRAIDSQVGRYRNETMELHFDYGPYSDPLNYGAERPINESFKMKMGKIDGKPAKIVRFHAPDARAPFGYVAAVYFADTGRPGNRLTVEVRCRSPKDYPNVSVIFSSIRFVAP